MATCFIPMVHLKGIHSSVQGRANSAREPYDGIPRPQAAA
jgi:hypothetical protein